MTFSTQPDERTNETQEAEISLGELVESRENAPVMLDLVDQAFHQMTLFVEMSIIVVLLLASSTRRNDWLGTAVQDNLTKWIGIIGHVGNHILTFVTGEQSLCLSDIMTLPAGQCKPQRIAQCIDVDMDLGAESASAAAQRLSRLPAALVQGASGTGMCTNNGTIQDQTFHVRVIGKVLMHAFPDAVVTPAGESPVNAIPVAVPFRQQAPLGAAASDPQHAFQKETAGGFLSRIDARTGAQEGENPCPLIILYSDC